jgi:hypothetical protein
VARCHKWSAVVAVWSFRVERGGGRRCAAVEGGVPILRVGQTGGRLASMVNMGVVSEKSMVRNVVVRLNAKRNIIYMPVQVLVWQYCVCHVTYKVNVDHGSGWMQFEPDETLYSTL